MKTTKSTPKTMRPSPSVSATLYPEGKTMRGNDVLRDRDKLAYDFFINKAEYNPKKHIFED
jgi:hypothetical protein